jgi:hypothetical protein
MHRQPGQQQCCCKVAGSDVLALAVGMLHCLLLLLLSPLLLGL